MIAVFQVLRDAMMGWFRHVMLELDNPYNTVGRGSCEAEQLMKELVHFLILVPLFYLVAFPGLIVGLIGLFLVTAAFSVAVTLPVTTICNLLRLAFQKR